MLSYLALRVWRGRFSARCLLVAMDCRWRHYFKHQTLHFCSLDVRTKTPACKVGSWWNLYAQRKFEKRNALAIKARHKERSSTLGMRQLAFTSACPKVTHSPSCHCAYSIGYVEGGTSWKSYEGLAELSEMGFSLLMIWWKEWRGGGGGGGGGRARGL